MIHNVNNEFGSVCLTIECDTKNNWIFYHWKGFIRMRDIELGYNKIAELIAETKIVGILADHSQIVGPWNEANDWLINDWSPRAIDAGMKFWAINTGNDLFSNISLEMFLTKNSRGVYKVQVFNQLDEAKKWLSNRLILSPNQGEIEVKKPKELNAPDKKNQQAVKNLKKEN